MAGEDLYTVLGILPDAEEVVVTAAYRALAKRYHPDAWKGDPNEAHLRMIAINEAYSILGDKARRAEYDKSRACTSQFEFSASADENHDQSESFDSAMDAEIKPIEKETTKISERPMKVLFWFYGLLFGQGLAKFLTRTYIIYPRFTDPNTAGNSAFILTGIVVIASAWLSSKMGKQIAFDINQRTIAKNKKTVYLWLIGIVAFIPYLLFGGWLINLSNKANNDQSLVRTQLYGQSVTSNDYIQQQPESVGNSKYIVLLSQSEYDLADQYIKAANWEGLKDMASQKIGATPAAADTWFYYGYALYKLNNYSDAVVAMTNAININPSGHYYNIRGLAYSAIGNAKNAIVDFNFAIERLPNEGHLYFNRGVVYKDKLSNKDAALSDYQNACELGFKEGCKEAEIVKKELTQLRMEVVKNKNDEAFIEGRKYYYESNYALAINKFGSYIQHNQSNVDAYYFRGMAYYRLNQYKKAIEDFTNAIQLGTHQESTYYRGLSYEQIKQYNKAAIDFTKVIELSPSDFNAYDHRGYIYKMSKMYDNARSDFNAACRMRSKYACDQLKTLH